MLASAQEAVMIRTIAEARVPVVIPLLAGRCCWAQDSSKDANGVGNRDVGKAMSGKDVNFYTHSPFREVSFFVNSRLIPEAGNEAELAGVMAHETAHVAARHGMRQPPGWHVGFSLKDAGKTQETQRINWMQDFTSDDDKIRYAVKNLKPGSMGEARMLDAIVEVADRMQQRKGRKMLVLISETRDRGSETKFQQAMEAVERQGIQVFAAHYSAYATSFMAKPKDLPELPPAPDSDDPEDPPNPPPTVDFLAMIFEAARLGKTNAVQALTQVTGGSDYPFAKERGIENAIEKLGGEVHNQYILSFPQRKKAAGMHRIDVLVPNHTDLLIRSRRTYWAEPASDAQ